MSQRSLCCVWFLFVSALAAPTHAQENGTRVSGFFGGTFGEGQTNLGAGGTVGYRFTRHIGFDFQALALPNLKLEDSDSTGRGVAFLTNFVTEFPTPARWLTPYVEGGGGIANISQSFSFQSARENDPRFFPRRRGDPIRTTDNGLDLRRSETNLALTVGGGVDFNIWRGLAVGPNITYLKLFGNLQDRDFTRIGGRASYRF